jgi:S-DNA-T family DNA segregation ATPase FtsK/SpoIIIE
MPVLAQIARFLRKRMIEIAGLGLLGLALLLVTALVSYSANDPSFNHATGAHPVNLLGYGGAAAADILVQTIGFGAAALILPLASWGWYLFHSDAKRLGPVRLWVRLVSWPFALITLCAFSAAMPAPANWPLAASLGGVLGDGTADLLTRLFAAAGPGRAGFLATFLAGTAAILALSAATGFGARELWRLGEAAVAGAGTADEHARAFWARIAPQRAGLADWWAEHIAPRLGPLAPHPDEGTDVAEEGEEPAEPSFKRAKSERTAAEETVEARAGAKRVIKPVITPAKGSKREAREAQVAFDLGETQDFSLPPLGVLTKPKPMPVTELISEEALEQNARLLEAVLEDFGIRGEILHVRPGPVVTLYELRPAPGIKSSRIISLADDIARSMSAVSARVAVIPGRNVIGIELPNQRRETVYLRELLSSSEYEKSPWPLTLALGKTIGGEAVMADIGAMPHLLIAGTTGSGKSVAINTMILSLLYRLTPEHCRMILIDPKMLELSVYDGIPHLLAPVVTEPKKAVVALKWVVKEMEDRYRKMSKIGVRNIAGFNQRLKEAEDKGEVLKRTVQTGFDRATGSPIFEDEELAYAPLPFIVVVVDEMADLMMVAGKDIETAVQRLAQMARAAGIHLITATQRPSVDVITGTIKANFPTRISFQVTSKIDSRTILGEQGAEQLLGQGDMLYMAGGGRIRRVHGPFVSDAEVEEVVSFLKRQAQPEYLEAVTQGGEDDEAEDPFAVSGFGDEGSGDALYDQAVAIVARERRVSTSYIQRRLQIGYNRAARLVEQMEEQGIVSQPNHQGKREILVGDHSGEDD